MFFAQKWKIAPATEELSSYHPTSLACGGALRRKEKFEKNSTRYKRKLKEEEDALLSNEETFSSLQTQGCEISEGKGSL